MKCDDVQRHLAEYRRQLLEPALLRQVEEHLQACASCRNRLELYGRIVAIAERAYDTTTVPPAGLERIRIRVRHRLEAAANKVPPPSSCDRRSRKLVLAMEFAKIAAAVLVGFVTAVVYYRPMSLQQSLAVRAQGPRQKMEISHAVQKKAFEESSDETVLPNIPSPTPGRSLRHTSEKMREGNERVMSVGSMAADAEQEAMPIEQRSLPSSRRSSVRPPAKNVKVPGAALGGLSAWQAENAGSQPLSQESLAESHESTSAMALYVRAGDLALMGKYEEAYSTYWTLGVTFPPSALSGRALVNAGNIAADKIGDPDRAIQAFRQVLETSQSEQLPEHLREQVRRRLEQLEQLPR